MITLKRNCPGCNREVTYSRRYGFNRAIKENRMCLSCSGTGRKHSDETKRKFVISKTGNKNPMFGKPSWNKGKSSWSRGKRFSSSHKDKISHSLTGKSLSAEHRYKLRVATINDAKNKGIKFGGTGASNYNQTACDFI